MTFIELVTGHEPDADAAVMLAKLKGAAIGERPHEAETQAFCDRLKDVTYRSYASNLAQPDLTPLPRGYRNLRVYDARDGASLGSR